jgi:hypothetical protein
MAGKKGMKWRKSKIGSKGVRIDVMINPEIAKTLYSYARETYGFTRGTLGATVNNALAQYFNSLSSERDKAKNKATPQKNDFIPQKMDQKNGKNDFIYDPAYDPKVQEFMNCAYMQGWVNKLAPTKAIEDVVKMIAGHPQSATKLKGTLINRGVLSSGLNPYFSMVRSFDEAKKYKMNEIRIVEKRLWNEQERRQKEILGLSIDKPKHS